VIAADDFAQIFLLLFSEINVLLVILIVICSYWRK